MARYVSKVARGKTTRSQAREIIWRISEFMANESKVSNDERIPINKCLERTAAACDFSKTLIKEIRRELTSVRSEKLSRRFREMMQRLVRAGKVSATVLRCASTAAENFKIFPNSFLHKSFGPSKVSSF
ncbi:hypothetical protein J6590_055802 [Homalodisca vitripennis]|nr:hypothetical protein J6590_055802 [Homalodisca vitripennis]